VVELLVMAAAQALVAAMATDGWQRAQAGAAALWRRVHPERVLAVEAELEEVRDEVLAAHRAGAGDGPVAHSLIDEWQRKLGRLVAADPGITVEMRRVLDEEWLPLLSAAKQAAVRSITMTATASGRGQVIQAGRDVVQVKIAETGGVIADDIHGGVNTTGNRTLPYPDQRA